jgi:plasmid stabilization system protein ParE
MICARLSPRAVRDLEAICRLIATDNHQAAEHVRLTILDTADFLVQDRGIGRRILNASARHADIRWLVVPKYRNYLMFCRPFQNTVMVVRIVHAAQDWTRFFPPKE